MPTLAALRKSKLALDVFQIVILLGSLLVCGIDLPLHPTFVGLIVLSSLGLSRLCGIHKILPGMFNEADFLKVLQYCLLTSVIFAGDFIGHRASFAFTGKKTALFFLLLSYGNIILRLLITRTQLKVRKGFETSTLIIGAGNAGEQIIRQLRKNGNYQVKAIVDDDPKKLGKTLFSVTVEGTIKDIPMIVQKHSIGLALIAIPSANHTQINQMVQLCLDSGIAVKTLPDSFHVLDDKVNMAQFREINIEDLLTRKTVDLDTRSIVDYIKSRHVLITGAGGSIGSELCFQASKLNCREITLVDNNEFGLYEIDLKLRESFPELKINTFIGDVRNLERMEFILSETKPQLVFHAAAYKHVPMMEGNPVEAIQTNILGSLNTLKASQKAGAEQFVLVSTDKAVNPTNVMGTSKRLAEIVLQQNADGKIKLNIVRFGNVLNSRGSVIPRFVEQIKRGGPLTVTHPEITRYFMSIPEAAQLLLKAASFERTGEIFLLDMGLSVKIFEMAKNLIRLHGLIPEKDIEIKFSGLRPGEKLYEELLADSEKTTETPEPKIRAAKTSAVTATASQIEGILRLNWKSSREEILTKLREAVPEFVPENH